MAIDQITNNRITKLETTVNGQIKDYIVNFASITNVILPANISTVIDGQVLTNNGLTFLLTNQTNKAENGVYAVLSISPFTFGRINTFQSYEQINNSRIEIRSGTKAGNFYLVNTTLPFVLGTTEITVEDVDPVQENLVEGFTYLKNLNNINAIYIDFNGGNDTTGTGSQNYPFKTLSKAVTLCTDKTKEYTIKVAQGIYQELTPSITVPANISLIGDGSSFGAFQINIDCTDITESKPIYSQLQANFTMDLNGNAITQVCLPFLINGTYSLTRLDNNNTNRFVKISNSNINILSVVGSVEVANSLFTNSCNVNNNGYLLIKNSTIGIQITAQELATIEIIGSTFVGAIQGTTLLTNKTIVKSDSSTITQFINNITNCNIVYIDDASTINYIPDNSTYFSKAQLTTKEALDENAYKIYNIDGGIFN